MTGRTTLTITCTHLYFIASFTAPHSHTHPPHFCLCCLSEHKHISAAEGCKQPPPRPPLALTPFHPPDLINACYHTVCSVSEVQAEYFSSAEILASAATFMPYILWVINSCLIASCVTVHTHVTVTVSVVVFFKFTSTPFASDIFIVHLI